MSEDRWIVQYDEESGYEYYLNQATGESSWDRPADYQQEAAAEDVYEDGEDEEYGLEEFDDMEDDESDDDFAMDVLRQIQHTQKQEDTICQPLQSNNNSQQIDDDDYSIAIPTLTEWAKKEEEDEQVVNEACDTAAPKRDDVSYQVPQVLSDANAHEGQQDEYPCEESPADHDWEEEDPYVQASNEYDYSNECTGAEDEYHGGVFHQDSEEPQKQDEEEQSYVQVHVDMAAQEAPSIFIDEKVEPDMLAEEEQLVDLQNVDTDESIDRGNQITQSASETLEETSSETEVSEAKATEEFIRLDDKKKQESLSSDGEMSIRLNSANKIVAVSAAGTVLTAEGASSKEDEPTEEQKAEPKEAIREEPEEKAKDEPTTTELQAQEKKENEDMTGVAKIGRTRRLFSSVSKLFSRSKPKDEEPPRVVPEREEEMPDIDSALAKLLGNDEEPQAGAAPGDTKAISSILKMETKAPETSTIASSNGESEQDNEARNDTSRNHALDTLTSLLDKQKPEQNPDASPEAESTKMLANKLFSTTLPAVVKAPIKKVASKKKNHQKPAAKSFKRKPSKAAKSSVKKNPGTRPPPPLHRSPKKSPDIRPSPRHNDRVGSLVKANQQSPTRPKYTHVETQLPALPMVSEKSYQDVLKKMKEDAKKNSKVFKQWDRRHRKEETKMKKDVKKQEKREEVHRRKFREKYLIDAAIAVRVNEALARDRRRETQARKKEHAKISHQRAQDILKLKYEHYLNLMEQQKEKEDQLLEKVRLHKHQLQAAAQENFKDWSRKKHRQARLHRKEERRQQQELLELEKAPTRFQEIATRTHT